MKILILTISHIWYDNRVYFKVCQSLLKRDVTIHLITGNSADTTNIVPDERMTIDFVGAKYHSHIQEPTDQPVEEKHLSHIQETIHFNKAKIISYFFKKGLELKPDIVICIEPLTLMAGYLLKKRLGCRFVYDCHEYFVDSFRERHRHLAFLYKGYEDFFARSSDAVITVNHILVDKFRTLNQKVFLCENVPLRGAQKTDLRPPTTDHRPPTTDAIYIGSISFERGLKIYLATAKLFKDNGKDFKFTIVGNFKNQLTERYFCDFITQHNLSEYIVYHKYLPNNEAVALIGTAKVGVFFADIEASPRYDKAISVKVYEYMSQATPVVTNTLDMLSPFLAEAQCGWSIEYDSTALYNLLTEILPNEALLKEKGQAGYQYLIDNLCWEHQEPVLYEAVFGNYEL